MASWWSHVSGTAMQGLQITLVGMALVFFTLGLIILSMVLLTHLPRLRGHDASEQSEETAEEPATEATVVQPAAVTDDLAQIAAIAVALVRSMQRTRRPTRPAAAVNAWKQVGRSRQLGL